MKEEEFSEEADYLLRKLGIKKRDRIDVISHLIESTPPNMMNATLDDIGMQVQSKRNNRKRPTESTEQKNFVEWFKTQFDNGSGGSHKSIIIMIRNDGSRTVKEKTGQLLMGLHPGTSDLYIPEYHVWLEMKRQLIPKYQKQQDEGILSPVNDLSEDQIKFKHHVEHVLNETYIIGYGFEDAKKMLLECI